MSTFKMGLKNLLVVTTLLLIWKVCRIQCQCQGARVEYINQPYCSPVATTVQPSSQLVVPSMIKPFITPCDSYLQEPVPSVPSFCGYNNFNGYQSYAPSYSQPMPPIIIEDDKDDSWHHLLYFLIFAMRNRRNNGNYGGCGGYNGGCVCGGGCNGGCGGYNVGYNGGCGCGGNCGGGCGGGFDNGFGGCGNCGGYFNNNCGSGYSYIPYPIPYPINGPYPYSFPGFGGFPDNSGSVEEPYQTASGSTDINLYIRADNGCSCTC